MVIFLKNNFKQYKQNKKSLIQYSVKKAEAADQIRLVS